MVRNTDGLKRSARSRSEDAMQRATAAILLMQSEEAEINFRSVATRAKVSTAWLYGTKSLRDKIMKIRTTSPAAAGENLQHRQRLSHERVVATLRLRIRTLEEINRELKEQLEAAYGRLAVPYGGALWDLRCRTAGQLFDLSEPRHVLHRDLDLQLQNLTCARIHDCPGR
jgi:hypothetical protein